MRSILFRGCKINTKIKVQGNLFFEEGKWYVSTIQNRKNPRWVEVDERSIEQFTNMVYPDGNKIFV